MPGSEDWVKRVVSLAQWRHGGERAPHKPLLLLYTLGRLQRTGSSAVSFVDAEGDLSRLLEEFGPPRKTTPVYPFHHLTNDGLWEVRTPTGVGSPGPTLTALRAGAVGELDVEFSRSLVRDPRLFASVVRAILDAEFSSDDPRGDHRLCRHRSRDDRAGRNPDFSSFEETSGSGVQGEGAARV